MAADTQIECLIQIFRHTRANARQLLRGPIDYSLLDETGPDSQVYLNGGAPDGRGRTLMTKQVPIEPGEYLVFQAKNYSGGDVVFDSDGDNGTSLVFIVGLKARDLNTGEVYEKYLVPSSSERSTDLFGDDPTLTDGKWDDFYAFKVPDGERWQPFGLFRADLRTNA